MAARIMNLNATTSGEAETEQFAAALGRRLRGGDVLALSGPLGAGKTCFVRGLAQGLGIDPRQVSSPTFRISQEYTCENGPTLMHIDAYRLHGTDELEGIGWDELLEANDVVIAIEWPSRVEAALANLNPIEIRLKPVSVTQRLIEVHSSVQQASRLEGFHE